MSAADLRAADGIAARGRLGVAVVLDHEYGGQIPDLGQIVAFENSALVGAAVADETDRHAAGLQDFRRQRRAADQRTAGPDDAVRPQHAFGEVGDVHRAALAPAQAFAASEDLQHHRIGVAALGDAMAVAAMGRGDDVTVVEMQADADAGRFLAGIEMHEPRNAPGGEFVVHRILELADRPHLTIRAEQLFSRQLQCACHFLSSLAPTRLGRLRPHARVIRAVMSGQESLRPRSPHHCRFASVWQCQSRIARPARDCVWSTGLDERGATSEVAY